MLVNLKLKLTEAEFIATRSNTSCNCALEQALSKTSKSAGVPNVLYVTHELLTCHQVIDSPFQ